MKTIVRNRKRINNRKSQGQRRQQKRNIQVQQTLGNRSLVIALDLGKEKMDAWFGKLNKEPLQTMELPCSAEGLAKLLSEAKRLKHTGHFSKVIFAMEPTGHYWMVIAQYLVDHNCTYRLIHPLTVAREREQQRYHRGKCDTFDAWVIASLLIDGKFLKSQLTQDPLWADLRSLAQEVLLMEKFIAADKTRLGSLLERAMPEYKNIFRSGIDGDSFRACLKVLEHYPDPLKLSWPQFLSQVDKHYSKTRLCKVKVQKLYDLLRGSSLGNHVARRGLFARAARALARIELFEQQEAQTEARLLALYRQTDYVLYLHTLPTSPINNALLLGLIGDPANYDHARALPKLAGSIPREKQSGSYQGKTPIIKSGRAPIRDVVIRKIIYRLKYRGLWHTKYQQLLRKGLTTKQAEVALANKYLRSIFVICTRRIAYQPALAA
jgi:transposase